MKPYSYFKLPHGHIRILRLLPGTLEQPLRGSIEHALLVPEVEFEALSYVWGSDLKPFQLETSEGTVDITASLHSALKHLRHATEARTLWADALCINQTDDQEKSYQVRLMYEIYRTAKHVLVFLGEQSHGSEAVPSVVDSICQYESTDDNQNKGLGMDIKPLSLLLLRPWFRRVWILQECIAAKNFFFICGSWEIPFESLLQAVDSTYSFSGLSLRAGVEDKAQWALVAQGSFTLSTIDMGRDMISVRDGKQRVDCNLLDLLELFQGHESTWARDHLFSLLSLATDVSSDLFNPTYTEPFERIVRRYAEGFVNQGKVFQLIASAGLTDHSQPERFPTWVPDWTKKRRFRYGTGLTGNSAVYCAGGNLDPNAHYDPQDDALVVKGRIFDHVERLACLQAGDTENSAASSTENEMQLRYFQQCETLITNHGNLTQQESSEDILWRTLIADRDFDGEELDHTKMKSSYKAFRLEIGGDPDHVGDLYLSETMTSDEQDGVEYSLPFSQLGSAYQFCISHSGYTALIPRLSRVHDRICVIYGCPTPFVVRKSTLRPTHDIYHLVGRCYVHGVMNGELLRSHDSPENGNIRLH